MNTLVIVPLIVPTLIIIILILLIIKERDYLYPNNLFKENLQKNKQKNSSERDFVQKKKDKNSSDEINNNFLDFSGGMLGI